MKYLEATLISIVAVFAPIKTALLVIMLLVVADCITGMLAARKRGEKITSAKLRNTLSKFLIYNTAMLLGFLTEIYLLESSIPISKVVGGIVGATEIKSLVENLNTISGSDLFKVLIEKLGSKNLPQVSSSEDSSGSSNKEEDKK